MGKQGSPRSPRPEAANNEDASPETVGNDDPAIGRRPSAAGDYYYNSNSKPVVLFRGFNSKNYKGYNNNNVANKKKNIIWFRKHLKSIALTSLFMGFVLLLDSLMVSIFDSVNLQSGLILTSTSYYSSTYKKENRKVYAERSEKSPGIMYNRLLNMASSALVEKESSDFWEEPYRQVSSWKPCADRKLPTSSPGRKIIQNNGYILVSANGGLNQQRVAICNAVAVASLLNATLVLPRFLYSNVWKDPSQFGDIYQENHFIKSMGDEIDVVKDLPSDMKSVDIEGVGSLITDSDLPKEASPADYIETVLPLLLRNRVVHFLGYGNRLGFDPMPFELQKLRCKCNFHALKFVPKIQKAGSTLVKRIRKYDIARNALDTQLLGDFIAKAPPNGVAAKAGPNNNSKYLALHLRFEIDMVAYSLCEFGGGEAERTELKAYRELHFPLVVERLKSSSKRVSPEELRVQGKCPLTPEEAGLVLAGLGFESGTYIYLAGSHIYGGESRMDSFRKLYPNLVTKETLLTPSELAPFRNFSSQLAALDFIACATSDVFAMTDSGSQLSSLVSGYRTYYSDGEAPNLRPNKKRLASILSESESIEWSGLEERVRKMIEEGQRVRVRRLGRSIYRLPRCPQCMCKLR